MQKSRFLLEKRLIVEMKQKKNSGQSNWYFYEWKSEISARQLSLFLRKTNIFLWKETEKPVHRLGQREAPTISLFFDNL